METEIECPYCGEPGDVDADVDPGEPGEHVFVQDCGVCCRPWTVTIHVDHRGDISIAVSR